MTTGAVEARVARGAAWLDKNEPGWEGRIDLAKLNLANGCRCVLGQLKGDFTIALGILFGETWDPAGETRWAVAHGFVTEEDNEYPLLDEAWISLIKERHDTGNLS